MLHQPARLKIMMLLATTPVATFNGLARDAALTPGNLVTHLRHLEAAGYAESIRGLVELKPRMRYRITPRGRTALKEYCAALEEALRDLQRVVGE